MGELKDGVLYTFDEWTGHWVEADEVVPEEEYRLRSPAADLVGIIIPCPDGAMVSGWSSGVQTKTFDGVRCASFEDAKAALLAWLQRGEKPTGDAELKPEAPKPEPAIEAESLDGSGFAPVSRDALKIGIGHYRCGERWGSAMVDGALYFQLSAWPAGYLESGAPFRKKYYHRVKGEARVLEALRAWLECGIVPADDFDPKPEPTPADEVATLRAEVERLNELWDEAVAEADRLGADNVELDGDNKQLRYTIDQLTAERDAALAKVEELRAEAKDRAHWEQQGGDELRAEIARLTAELVEARNASYINPSKDRAEVERLRVDLAQAREEISRLTALQESSARDKQDHDDHVLGLCAARVTVEGVLRKCLDVALVELRHAVQEKTLLRVRVERELGEEVDA